MLKHLVKRSLRVMGFEVRRFRPESSEVAQFIAMLMAHNVNLIFDIGANTGRSGVALRDGGYRRRIVSFEPLSAAHQQLLKTSASDRHWEIAPRMAVGECDGEVEINIAGNSESSSILDMLNRHSHAAPDSRYIGREKVPVVKLDTIAERYLHPDSSLFLKIDTQGYEDRVLAGASRLLERTVGMQLELSLVPLYSGQCLYDEMLQYLTNLGFRLWGLSPVFADPESGRLLQVDATFFRGDV